MHPDLLSKHRFLDIQEAYEVLSKPELRTQYDIKFKLHQSYTYINQNKYNQQLIYKSIEKIEKELNELGNGQIYQENLFHYLFLILQPKILNNWIHNLPKDEIQEFFTKIISLSNYLEDKLKLKIFKKIEEIYHSNHWLDNSYYLDEMRQIEKRIIWMKYRTYLIIGIGILLCWIIAIIISY